MNLDTLIAQLGNEPPKKQLKSPVYYLVLLGTICLIYGIITQCFLGLRSDLAHQVLSPLFATEILLLSLLFMSSITAAIYAMYPDCYQNRIVLLLPYLIFIALIIILLLQLFSLPVPSIDRSQLDIHNMGCTLCIASISFVPSILLFALLYKGASAHPLLAGTFAALSAASIGCLTLRLAEMTDNLAHIMLWHYLPIFIFATLGAITGKYMLRW